MASKDKNKTEKRDDSSRSEIMRQLKTRPFLYIGTVLVFVIIVIAFVFVPAIVPDARQSGELIFGYYNKVPIRYVRDSYFFNVLQSLGREHDLSTDDPQYIFRMAQMWRTAFEEAVLHLGILDTMRQAGFIIPEELVDREMAELPHFQENGRFSSARYRAMDSNTRMNLWRQVQESLIKRSFYSDMEGIRSSSGEISFISSMAFPRRTFDLAIFPHASYPDNEVISFAQANPDLFLTMRLSKISVFSSEREARRLLEYVRSGVTTFEEAARSSSQDPFADRGGDMGLLMGFEIMHEISDTAARSSVINLPAGSISDLISIPGGWAFFRIDEAASMADTTDSSHIGRIRNYIINNLQGVVEDWLLTEAEAFTARVRAVGFDRAASERNVRRHSLGPLPVNYGNTIIFPGLTNTGIPELSEAERNPFFWRAAFSAPLNTPSDPVVVGHNAIVFFPREESLIDEEEIEMLESYLPYWINDGTFQTYRAYFLNNDKLDDRFNETFWRVFNPF